MNKLYCCLFFLFTAFMSTAQTPVAMALQPALTYTEHFDSIATWTAGFSSGYGAMHFQAVAAQGAGSIPDPTYTTETTDAFATGTMGGIHKDIAAKRIKLLATGTVDNTNATAIDFLLNFSGVSAGTLSFHWATVNNGSASSNRRGSLRIYGSIDGVSFTEITAAQVLNITNHVTDSGDVLNVLLPPMFTNMPTARLRFYYYNGIGGTYGARPFIALDGLKITAYSTSPCQTPSAQPTSLQLNSSSATSVQGSFTPAVPAPDEYLVVMSSNSSLTSMPQDSILYEAGDNVGDGTVIYRGPNPLFAADSLTVSGTYYFFIFPVNLYCSGALRYNVASPLSGNIMLVATPCIAPMSQPSGLSFSNVTVTSIDGDFAPVTDATEYLVIVSAAPQLSTAPTDGIVYNIGSVIGNGTIVSAGGNTHFSAVGLTGNNIYYFFIFAANNDGCTNGPVYNASSPLTGQQSTGIPAPCTVPPGDATDFILVPDDHSIAGFFTPYNAGTNNYLVVMSTNSTLTSAPADGISYLVGNNIGGGTVVSTGNNFSYTVAGLLPGTVYYFFVFAFTDCAGGPLYRSSFLSGNAQLLNSPLTGYYFGNLHAHSSYSDGNKDNATLTPTDDYGFAKYAMCMDFLGISEHNHYSFANNPGMRLPYYAAGLAEAAAFNNANSSFAAMYAMEWGVIADGGHALIYGVPELWGWETINDTPNYDVFIPKSDYISDTGLFYHVNDHEQSNAFAALAHPSSADYDNLLAIPYNPGADSAIAAVAVESGPAFSTDTSYSDPGSSMSYLGYFKKMLAKGYHVAPIIDHDNHNLTFGHTASSRTAIISPALSQTALIQSVHDMHCYATQDCDTRIAVSIYGKEMGSVMAHSFAPAIQIGAMDPTNAGEIPIIKLMSGVPGSNVPPVQIKADTSFSLSFTDLSLADGGTAYYYADVAIGNMRSISAPVWYTREDALTSSASELPEKRTGVRICALAQNPVHEEITLIPVAEKSGLASYQVQSLDGRTVSRGQFYLSNPGPGYVIDASHFSPGAYLLQINMDGKRQMIKFIRN